jgi:hypothetical protein
MNLTKLGTSSWIVILNIVLISILLAIVMLNRRERFINYPQQVNPTVKPASNPDTNTANNNYASLLLFLQNNPSKSVKFIQDIKQKIFKDGCEVKNDIDFDNLAKLPNGMVF